MMHRPPQQLFLGTLAALALLAVPVLRPAAAGADDLVALGRALFHDPNLSLQRTQACATCHDPQQAFADPRDNPAGGAVSLGADGRSLGTRNSPSIAYAAVVPAFALDAGGVARGGLFLDGRADDLVAQATGPLFNPLEMALPDRSTLLARVRENPGYLGSFAAQFGRAVLDDPDRLAAAVAAAIAAFESQAPFVAFDSRYDRYLAGAEVLSADEELGRQLFFSDLVNCRQCHLLEPGRITAREPFTDQRYYNIGVPANPALAAQPPDRGLGGRAGSADPAQDGRFRTPTLRNVLLTAPYMHNGVFRELATVLKFYNQHLVGGSAAATNPETGAHWGAPEVAANRDDALLRQGQPLDQERIRQLTAFLATLTDRRYEHLLPAATARAAD